MRQRPPQWKGATKHWHTCIHNCTHTRESYAREACPIDSGASGTSSDVRRPFPVRSPAGTLGAQLLNPHLPICHVSVLAPRATTCPRRPRTRLRRIACRGAPPPPGRPPRFSPWVVPHASPLGAACRRVTPVTTTSIEHRASRSPISTRSARVRMLPPARASTIM